MLRSEMSTGRVEVAMKMTLEEKDKLRDGILALQKELEIKTKLWRFADVDVSDKETDSKTDNVPDVQNVQEDDIPF